MKKAFISYSFTNKEEFKSFDKDLRLFLKDKFAIEAYSFVFDFGEKTDNKTLMKSALKKIDDSDVIFLELSYKSIGVGLEAGFAKARGKKIVYIHKVGTELSTTVDGISDIRIEYKDLNDLCVQLSAISLI